MITFNNKDVILIKYSFLSQVVVSDLNNPSWKYFFSCSKWFAKSEGDGMICRDLLAGSRKGNLMNHVNRKDKTYLMME